MAVARHTIISKDYPRLLVEIGVKGLFSAHEYALVDTGFEGAVVVPEGVLKHDLGNPDGLGTWRVAGGGLIEAPLYMGAVNLIGTPDFNPWFVVPVAVMGNKYIIGRELIDQFAVTFDHGKRVILKP